MAVKAVILDDSWRCLLVRRSAANASSVGCWEWPGGKVDPGEDFATAVLRETREETGLAVEITGLAGATTFETPKFNIVLLCMEARITGGEAVLSHEHDAWEWASLTEFGSRRLFEGVREFMLAYASRQGDPK
jgi:8-oxo-dGTP diphosphatase